MSSQSKTIAIMQPYVFPYLGYFQLAAAVDEFWLFDDVKYIQRGWMNRNRLLVNDQEYLFTLPIAAGRQNQLIKDKKFDGNAVKAVNKLERTLNFAYARAPFKNRSVKLVKEVAAHLSAAGDALDFTSCTHYSLQRTFELIGLTTPIARTSQLNIPSDLRASARVRAVCCRVGATSYVNMIGGRHLYNAEEFAQDDISLSFLEAALPAYSQGGVHFVPGLSILDVIANVSAGQLETFLRMAQVFEANEIINV